ncbi:MAG: Hsp33 family molecular chaperone HslO [Desulfobacterales bacterium]|nr:Hsp33 family molecular chaperone HslO [Desulfobacterales bacterium]
MIKKQLPAETLKQRLLASAKDRLHNFLLAEGAVRGALLHGTHMVNEMRANHELGILETLVLGRAYLGIALMSANIKGIESVSLNIECSGPIKGLTVEANTFGEVRGFLKNVPIPIDKPMENFDLSPFFGAGFLSVIRNMADAKQPFTSKIELRYGNIAQDLANYYLTSEQIPTAFNLSIQYDKKGRVTGAGGLFLQAMPGADDRLATELEDLVVAFPSLGQAFAREREPEELVQTVFEKYAPRFLADKRIEFMCHCSPERLRRILKMLPIDQLQDIRDEGPFPLEMRCHFCNTRYHFTKEEIQKIYAQRNESS